MAPTLPNQQARWRWGQCPSAPRKHHEAKFIRVAMQQHSLLTKLVPLAELVPLLRIMLNYIDCDDFTASDSVIVL